jgi:hypothetical protein
MYDHFRIYGCFLKCLLQFPSSGFCQDFWYCQIFLLLDGTCLSCLNNSWWISLSVLIGRYGILGLSHKLLNRESLSKLRILLHSNIHIEPLLLRLVNKFHWIWIYLLIYHQVLWWLLQYEGIAWNLLLLRCKNVWKHRCLLARCDQRMLSGSSHLCRLIQCQEMHKLELLIVILHVNRASHLINYLAKPKSIYIYNYWFMQKLIIKITQ